MNRLNGLSYLSHEIGTTCNMTPKHTKCPSNKINRYANVNTDFPISDELILQDIEIAYKFGFNGLLTWHFYNEPMLEIERIERLEKHIHSINKDAKLCLWTNGSLIKDNDPDWKRYDIFDSIIISNYQKRDWRWFKELRSGIVTAKGTLDHRLNPVPGNVNGCSRISKELIIDAYGNWRLCCADFVGGAVRMNVKNDGFYAIICEYNRLKDLIKQNPQPEEVPEICGRCRVR